MGFDFGIYSWTIQTHLQLKAAGYATALSAEIPREGIVVAHRECLKAVDGYYTGAIRPTKNVVVVELTADLTPYPFANIHVVQNKWQEKLGRNFVYMPHWPQPCLVPRDPRLGNRFTHVGYFGQEKNLPALLRSEAWKAEMKAHGFNWISSYREFYHDRIATYRNDLHWSDYSNLDAIVAVRSGNADTLHNHKPASKMFNAWLAGIPGVFGRESAYRYEGSVGRDYIEVQSVHDIVPSLLQLRDDVQHRQTIIANGRSKAGSIEPMALTQRWIDLFERRIIPAYLKWTRKRAAARHVDMGVSVADYYFNRVSTVVSRKRINENFINEVCARSD